MDSFLTTYKQDYLWPYGKNDGLLKSKITSNQPFDTNFNNTQNQNGNWCNCPTNGYQNMGDQNFNMDPNYYMGNAASTLEMCRYDNMPARGDFSSGPNSQQNNYQGGYQIQYNTGMNQNTNTCNCQNESGVDQSRVLDRTYLGEQNWSRSGPMGRLLDPKVYPAKVGPSPQVATCQHDQPNTFLRKLQEKYPELYKHLQKAPDQELLDRVNRYRLQSTYQVDYCKEGGYNPNDVTRLLAASLDSGKPSCPQSTMPEDPCVANKRRIALRPSTISKQGAAQKSGGGGSSEHAESKIQYMLRSEYKDTISKLGSQIIHDGIHSTPVQRRSPALS